MAVMRFFSVILLVSWSALPMNGWADPFEVSFGAEPEHAVLFVIDGLSYKVWEKMELPTLEKMVRTGALVEKNYLPPAAHPHTGVYARIHTCSIPNPIMMAGTVFIDEETEYLPGSSFAGKVTAFSVNSLAYRSINRGYNYSFQKSGDDSEAVSWALEFMRRGGPAFMRVHLQRPGGAGSQSLWAKEGADWRFNIWADGSPYRKAVARADSLLGVFLEGLEEAGVLEKTVVLVLGDHGQNDSGWHPLEYVDSSITSIVLWGAGVEKGKKIPYAEMIDVVPTICALMGVEPPKTSRGRVIAEALTGFSGEVPERKMLMKEMLDQFVSYRKKMAEARYLIEKVPPGRQAALFTLLNGRVDSMFYDIHKFTEWPRFGTVGELLAHNREVMKTLDTLLDEIRNSQ